MVMPEPFYGGAADLAMIRQCLMDARDAAEVLGLDSDFRTEADSVLNDSIPIRSDTKAIFPGGISIGKTATLLLNHQSHLYGLFPGRHVSPASTPDLARASALVH